MKLIFFFLLLFCTYLSLAQTKFESGNYVDLSNVKHEGLIKNMDWKSNPTQIIFKKNSEDNDVITVNSDNLKEFEVYGISKYQKKVIEIDVSANQISEIGYIKEPIFERQELLLKVLLEGKSSLYSINYGVYGKYFYDNSSTGKTEELIYKKYKVNEVDAAKMRENGDNVYAYTTVLTNKEYLKQLFTFVNCNMDREKIHKVSYNESSLVKYFKEYNECINEAYVIHKPSRKTKVNIKALISSNYSSIELSNNNRSLYSNNFDNKFSLGGGIELELVFPYNNNKWAAFIETTFNTYKDNAVLKDDKGFSLYKQQNVNLRYNYIQLTPGLRHYFYLNEYSKISIDAIYNITKGIGNNLVDYEIEQDLIITKDMLYNFAIGVNYSYKNYTLGIRTYSKSNVLDNTSDNRYAKYSNLSFMFKYNFL